MSVEWLLFYIGITESPFGTNRQTLNYKMLVVLGQRGSDWELQRLRDGYVPHNVLFNMARR